ncbi:MAG TPA: hypothetical protein VFN22_01495 [Gemmatimonadales bacterium]|nr:hypothetical protein [Gemmatimonadales bacterium]
MIDKVYIGKIGLGMAAVFGIGMVVASGVDAGKHKVNEVVHTNATISVPLLGLPFRTAKGELGAMQTLKIERSAPDMIESFDLTVKLNDGVSADQFNNCEVTVVDPENLDEHTTFTCLTAADAGFEDLVQFGHVHFEPSGARHRLMIPRSVRDEIQRRGATPPVPPAPGTPGEADASDGSLNIKVNGKSIVEIHGDSAGGAVMIRNPETGEPIVDINGGTVKVNADSP